MRSVSLHRQVAARVTTLNESKAVTMSRPARKGDEASFARGMRRQAAVDRLLTGDPRGAAASRPAAGRAVARRDLRARSDADPRGPAGAGGYRGGRDPAQSGGYRPRAAAGRGPRDLSGPSCAGVRGRADGLRTDRDRRASRHPGRLVDAPGRRRGGSHRVGRQGPGRRQPAARPDRLVVRKSVPPRRARTAEIALPVLPRLRLRAGGAVQQLLPQGQGGPGAPGHRRGAPGGRFPARPPARCPGTSSRRCGISRT